MCLLGLMMLVIEKKCFIEVFFFLFVLIWYVCSKISIINLRKVWRDFVEVLRCFGCSFFVLIGFMIMIFLVEIVY